MRMQIHCLLKQQLGELYTVLKELIQCENAKKDMLDILKENKIQTSSLTLGKMHYFNIIGPYSKDDNDVGNAFIIEKDGSKQVLRKLSSNSFDAHVEMAVYLAFSSAFSPNKRKLNRKPEDSSVAITNTLTSSSKYLFEMFN